MSIGVPGSQPLVNGIFNGCLTVIQRLLSLMTTQCLVSEALLTMDFDIAGDSAATASDTEDISLENYRALSPFGVPRLW